MVLSVLNVSPLVHEKVKKLLSSSHIGYVLVTAKKSSKEDQLEVDMSFEGEAALASFLLEGAQKAIDGIYEEEVEPC